MQKERPNNKHSAIQVQVSVHCMDCIKAQSSIGKVFVIVFMHNIGITLPNGELLVLLWSYKTFVVSTDYWIPHLSMITIMGAMSRAP